MPAVPAKPPGNEAARLAALQELRVLDTLPERVFDDIVLLAAQICGTPIGVVSLVDGDRTWPKACFGLAAADTPRDLAFCAHAIVDPAAVLVVEDTENDPRFRGNPLVTGDPKIRFYAGAPIVTASGHALGTVCVVDTVPRMLDAAQLTALQALARQTVALFDLRLRTQTLERQAREVERLSLQALEEQRRSTELLALVSEGQRRLKLITDNIPALVAHIDHEERYRFLNGHIHRIFGTDVEGSLGRTMREVRGEKAYAQLAPHVAAALRGETASFIYSDVVDGQTLHYQSNYIPDVDAGGQVRGFFAMTFDVTELHETQTQLELLARVDTLTGLPNRRQFDERIEAALQRVRRLDQPMAVMFLDIDHFKDINDTLGHACGDEVLCEVGRRLSACVRATDLVARLAGDEFVVLLEGLTGDAELDRLADKVVSCIRPAFRIGQAVMNVTTSVGVSACTANETSAAEIVARADKALYRAKKLGRDRFVIV
jgi:diguanylate cyclase (GGDEF)-like protein/PAS domain S-box-containing protein